MLIVVVAISDVFRLWTFWRGIEQTSLITCYILFDIDQVIIGRCSGKLIMAIAAIAITWEYETMY